MIELRAGDIICELFNQIVPFPIGGVVGGGHVLLIAGEEHGVGKHGGVALHLSENGILQRAHALTAGDEAFAVGEAAQLRVVVVAERGAVVFDDHTHLGGKLIGAVALVEREGGDPFLIAGDVGRIAADREGNEVTPATAVDETFMDDGCNGMTECTDTLMFRKPKYTNNGDKLIILKRSIQGENQFQQSHMMNSHISFYNIDAGLDRNTSNITYAGRISLDKYNLAFGKGTLLNMDHIVGTYPGENTALGHYALMGTTSGSKNVAVGGKTLVFNANGSYNTALGFQAGNKLGSKDRDDSDSMTLTYGSGENAITIDRTKTSENTAIGYLALGKNETGFGNTIVGANSLKQQMTGDDNTSIGSRALYTMDIGYGNTAIGTGTCSNLKDGDYNICIGNYANPSIGDQHYSLVIGSNPTPGTVTTNAFNNSIPLITGHTQRVGNIINPTYKDNSDGYFDKELIVNAKRVSFRPFNGGYAKDKDGKDMQVPGFIFTSVPGDIYGTGQDGYGGDENIGVGAKAYFNLRYDPSSIANKENSVAMEIHAVDAQAVIGTFNPARLDEYYKTYNRLGSFYKDLSFNQVLRIDMPFKGVMNKLNHDKGRMKDHSNIIDPTARELIRSTKEKVGILGEFIDRKKFVTTETLPTEADYPETFELLLNSKVNISRVAAHVINVDEFGTQIIGGMYNPNIRPFEIVLNGNTEKPDFQITETMTNINVKDGVKFYNKGSIDEYVLYLNDIVDEGLVIGPRHDIKYQNPIGSTGKYTVKQAIEATWQEATSTASDARLKNISGNNTAGLEEINKIEVKNFTYKNDEKKTPRVGVIAQQLQKIFPNSVTKGDDGYLRIRTEEIFYAMVNSIKELCAKLQDLTAKVVGLDKRITELETQNKMLLEQNKAFEKRLEKLEKQAAK